MGYIGECRAYDAFKINAVVVIEVMVFIGDERLADDRGNARERHPDAIFLIDRREQRSVARENPRRARGLIIGHAADVGKVSRIRGNHARDGSDAEKYDQRGPDQ